MSIAIARELRDGEVVLTGAASAVPLAACLLAQARHAPSLTVLGAGVYINPRRLVPEFTAGWDCRPIAIADMADVYAVTEQGIDVMFYGGMQIDRYGCVNTHYVHTPHGRLRGPGMANTMLGHTARRTLLYTERHEPRTLVDEVEFASVVGHQRRGRTRADLGLGGAGPVALFTPEMVLRPDPAGCLQPATSLGAGPWAEAIAAVGWTVAATPVELLTPDPDEVELLREFVDPVGLLRGRGPLDRLGASPGRARVGA
jgi:glutaconate CoA-transferase, subunit B